VTIPRKTRIPRKAKRAATPLHPNRGKKAKKKPSVLRQNKRIKATTAQMKRLREAKWFAQDGLCADCLRPVSLESGHLHHTKFRSQGGAHTFENTEFLCPRCHGKRHGIKVK
jgi:5-methylcytosine-specific restriction endonuclease McrA